MASQPAPRPWFRLASIIRPPPPAPTRAPAPTPVPAPQQTFRGPPVAPPQQPRPPPPPTIPTPTPTAASPPPARMPPVTPAPMSSPVASPPAPIPIPRASAPSSPVLPAVQPAAVSSAAAASPSPGPPKPSSPAAVIPPPPSPSQTRSPIATPAPPPPVSSKPSSPVIKPSSSLPASPSQKAPATRPDAALSSSIPPSPKAKEPVPTSPIATAPASKSVPAPPVRAPTSPVPRSAPITTVKDGAATPISSPKIVKPWVETPPQSPKVKSFVRPPSPLVLPPAQLKADSDLEPIPAEAQQKTVLTQESDEKSKTSLKTSNGPQQRHYEGDAHTRHNGGAQNGRRELKKDKAGIHDKKTLVSEELGFRVVTLAGDNKGAIMELSPSGQKYVRGDDRHSLHEKGSARAWIHGQKLGKKYEGNDEEGNSKMKDEIHRASAGQSPPMDAFINSNVQVVNNSILYNSSCTHNDPGVHLRVSRIHSKNGF